MRRTSWAARFVLSAVLACSLAVPFVLTGCSSEESGGSAEERALSYVSPYDWGHNLDTSNGRYVYSENGEVKSRIGIDVSDHQRNVNWAAVAQDGIDFAMLRLGNRGSTEGKLYVDELFADNVLGVQSVGMPFGVYFFSQATSEDEAREEAQFVLGTLSSCGLSPESLAYPVVFDQEPVEGEGRANDLSADQLTANALAFCRAIEEAGYRPMVYGNQIDMAQRNMDELEAYLLSIVQGICCQAKRESDGDDIIRSIIDYIDRSYQYDITLQELAEKKYFMNASYLSRLFKAKCGKTFSKYLIEYRLEKSRELLEKTILKVSDIAAHVGYNDVSHYIQSFRKVYGVTPEQYRNSLEKPEE